MKKYEVYPEDIYVRLQNLEAWKEFKTRQKRNNLITGFALFFVLMLILTAASRIHYSENLPKVKWGYAMSSSLKQKLYTSGIVSAKSPQPLYGMEGLRIARISVAVGEEVKTGTVLYEVDTVDLQKKIDELSAEYSTWKKRYDAWYEDARTDTMIYEAQQKEQKILEWQELLEHQGKVKAEETGMILEIHGKAGYRMEDAPVIYYANEHTDRMFEAAVDAEWKDRIHIDDDVIIKFAKSREEVTEKIDRIEAQSGNYLVTVQLPEGKGQGEKEGTMEMNYSSSVYEYVVPIEALHKEEERFCIYVLEEKEGILGTELSADKLDVRVLEQSLTHAAIEEELLEKGTKIIISADKELMDGSIVREE